MMVDMGKGLSSDNLHWSMSSELLAQSRGNIHSFVYVCH